MASTSLSRHHGLLLRPFPCCTAPISLSSQPPPPRRYAPASPTSSPSSSATPPSTPSPPYCLGLLLALLRLLHHHAPSRFASLLSRLSYCQPAHGLASSSFPRLPPFSSVIAAACSAASSRPHDAPLAPRLCSLPCAPLSASSAATLLPRSCLSLLVPASTLRLLALLLLSQLASFLSLFASTPPAALALPLFLLLRLQPLPLLPSAFPRPDALIFFFFFFCYCLHLLRPKTLQPIPFILLPATFSTTSRHCPLLCQLHHIPCHQAHALPSATLQPKTKPTPTHTF